MDNLDQQRDIGKLWTAVERTNGDVRELRTALIGIDGNNGLRGELREFMERFATKIEQTDEDAKQIEKELKEAVDWGKRIWEVDRHVPGNCIGKKALDDYILDLNAKDKRSTDLSIELKKSRLAMIGAILVAGMYVGGDIITNLLAKGVTL